MTALNKTHDAIIQAIAQRRRHGLWTTMVDHISDLQMWGYIWRVKNSEDPAWRLTLKGQDYAASKGFTNEEVQ